MTSYERMSELSDKCVTINSEEKFYLDLKLEKNIWKFLDV